MTAIPPWKSNRVLAGAMMLIKGYATPIVVCDACGKPLERASGYIDIRFEGKSALFDCPHCGRTSTRPLAVPRASS